MTLRRRKLFWASSSPVAVYLSAISALRQRLTLRLFAKLKVSQGHEAWLLSPPNAHRLAKEFAEADEETFGLLSIARDLARLMGAA